MTDAALSIWSGERLQRWHEIASKVAEYYGVSLADVLGRRRLKDTVCGRHAIMWALRQQEHPRIPGKARWSWPQIGRFLGVDHTTCIVGARAHVKRLAKVNDDRPAFVHTLPIIPEDGFSLPS